MTEQTETEGLDWKDISLLIFGAVLVLAAIVAVAIHFGFGEMLFRAANALSHWAAEEWRSHQIDKYLDELIEGSRTTSSIITRHQRYSLGPNP